MVSFGATAHAAAVVPPVDVVAPVVAASGLVGVSLPHPTAIAAPAAPSMPTASRLVIFLVSIRPPPARLTPRTFFHGIERRVPPEVSVDNIQC
jgi:hypothetical protein